MTKRWALKNRGVVVLVFVVALGLNFAAGTAKGLWKPLESDAYYFFQLAQSLAQGRGYVVRDGFWPTEPSMQRMPGWPVAAAVALKVLPQAPPAAVMRGLNLAINAACAAAVCLLALELTRRRRVGLLAGGLYLFHPMGLVGALEGMSEPLFVLLAVLGAWLLARGLRQFAERETSGANGVIETLTAFVLLGLASLVRANFVLWIGFFGAGAAVWAWRARLWQRPAWVLLMLLGACLFVTPPALWMARNHRVCGAFPVLSTLRGQTFYGANNSVTAESRKYWGYWVFPNVIPGETPLYDLSRTMSEYEVDVHYYERGHAFLREHRARIPWMLLGKLVRAYVPIPWTWSAGTIVMSGYRLMLYGLFVLGLWSAWRTPMASYRAIFVAMVVTNVVMVLTFYGYSRFAFALEPFCMPFAAVALAGVIKFVTRRLQGVVTPAPEDRL